MYQEYKFWRSQGFRAVTAYGLTRYGISFLLDYLNGEK